MESPLRLFTGVNSCVLGLWTAILSNYLKLLTGDLAMVGYSETMQGVVKVTFSFVAGYFADRHKRDTAGHHKEKRAWVLEIAGMLSLIAAETSLIALFADDIFTPYRTDSSYPDDSWLKPFTFRCLSRWGCRDDFVQQLESNLRPPIALGLRRFG